MIPKFRGISISDENKGQWVYGNLIVDGNYAYIVNGVIECNDQYITIAEWCPVDLKTIGAFTGLFDTNGVEIFEGDVVIITDYDEFPRTVVRYVQGTYCLFEGDNCLEALTDYYEDMEIIGNIHENPELVEVAHD